MHAYVFAIQRQQEERGQRQRDKNYESLSEGEIKKQTSQQDGG